MKTRVSLSLDPELIREIDKKVDGLIVKPRSDAIERILKEHVTKSKTAVILAGGKPEKLLIKEIGIFRPLVSIGKKH